MCEITDHVTRLCGANAAGITNVYMISAKDIDTEPGIDAATHELQGAFALLPGKFFYRVEFTEETGSADDALTGEKDAEYIKLSIKFTVPGMQRTNVAQYQRFLGGRFVFVVQYTDGQYRYFGSKANGLAVKPAQKSGQYAGTARRGAEFECDGVSSIYAPFLMDSEAAAFVQDFVAA